MRVLREQRLLIVLAVLVFTGGALALSTSQDEVYQAQSALSFKEENAELGELGAAAPVTQSPAERSAIQAQNIEEPDVAEAARKRLKTTIPTATLLRHVAAQPEARTNLVVITVKWHEPQGAANIANAFADAAREIAIDRARRRYRSRVRSLQEQIDELPETRSGDLARTLTYERIARLSNLAETTRPADVVTRATANANPVSPKPVRTGLLGALLGLTLGVLGAFLRDSLDRRFRSARELRDELSLPLIGHVRDEVLGSSVLPSQNGRRTMTDQELEAFRILRTNVDFLDVDNPLRTVAVTSALPEEGKSTVAQALTCAYAAGGRRVLLVECDLRRPTLASRLKLAEAPGLSDYLAGSAGPQEVVQTVTIGSADAPGNGSAGATPTTFACITAGSRSPQPAELLGSERFKQFLNQTREAYDTVILDTSPLLSVVDTLALVPNVDGVVLCVRASRTTRDQARAAKAALHHFPARPSGIVITGVRSGDEGDYGYYSYSYAYGSQS